MLEVDLDAGRAITNMRSILEAKGSVVLTTERAPIESLCLAIHCSVALARAISSVKGAMRARLEITKDNVGSAGDTKAALDVEIADADGRLAHANIWSQTNLAHALAIGRLPSDAPLEAKFNLEQRPFEKLPVFFRARSRSPVDWRSMAMPKGPSPSRSLSPRFAVRICALLVLRPKPHRSSSAG